MCVACICITPSSIVQRPFYHPCFGLDQTPSRRRFVCCAKKFRTRAFASLISIRSASRARSRGDRFAAIRSSVECVNTKSTCVTTFLVERASLALLVDREDAALAREIGGAYRGGGSCRG